MKYYIKFSLILSVALTYSISSNTNFSAMNAFKYAPCA